MSQELITALPLTAAEHAAAADDLEALVVTRQWRFLRGADGVDQDKRDAEWHRWLAHDLGS